MDPSDPRAGSQPRDFQLLRFALALKGEATEVFSIDADDGEPSDPPDQQVPRLV